MRREVIFEMHSAASNAQRLRHVFGDDSLPIDIIATQLFQKQLRSLCFTLREQLSLEGPVDEEFASVLDTGERHVTRDWTGSFSNPQIDDRTIFERLALRRVRCNGIRWCKWQLLATYLQLRILPVFVEVPGALPWNYRV